MNKTSFLAMAIFLSVSTIALSAERQGGLQSAVACPTSLKSLLALPENTTKLDLSELNVVNDEVAPYNTEDVSITMLINQAKRMDEQDRARISTLDIRSSLLENSGFKTLVEGFLPLFPSLTVFNFICDGIRGVENEAILLRLLAERPSILYVNIVDNELAKILRHDVGNGMQQTDRDRVIGKVIVSYPSQIEDLPPQFPQWQETHKQFYKQQVAH